MDIKDVKLKNFSKKEQEAIIKILHKMFKADSYECALKTVKKELQEVYKNINDALDSEKTEDYESLELLHNAKSDIGSLKGYIGEILK